MVRTYVRKSDRANYPKEKLMEAVEKVKNGDLCAYKASIEYGIPRSTIVARVYDRYGLKSESLGRNTVLPEETERKLAKYLHYMEKYGLGLSRTEIMELVGHFVSKNNIKNPFKNGVPGEDWFLSFKNRYNLSVKKPQAVENSRKKACNPWTVYSYFTLLRNTMDELGLHNKPSHIWNLDETSFSKDPSKTKVVGLKGYAATRTIASPGKDNTTVLLGCSAAGDKTPPLIVFKGKHIWDEWTSAEGYPGTVYAATKNGWMQTDVFETFFEKVFLPTIGQKRPILLIYDGHATHVGFNIIEKAIAAGITIMKIPPHTSHRLQPLDLAVNKPFKDKWDQRLVKWQRLHIGQALSKKEFSKFIGEVWGEIDPKLCAAGFRKGGIYPFNDKAVPEESFQQDDLAEWKKQTTSAQTHSTPSCSTHTESVELSSGPSRIETQSENPTISSVPKSLAVPSLLSICLNYMNCHFKDSTKAVQIDTEIKALRYDARNFKILPLNHDLSNNCNTRKSDNTLTSEPPKITIKDDCTVKFNITFEDLLLEKIKAGAQTTQKRKRVAGGAEVITCEEVYKIQKATEEEKLKEKKLKEEKKIIKKRLKEEKLLKKKLKEEEKLKKKELKENREARKLENEKKNITNIKVAKKKSIKCNEEEASTSRYIHHVGEGTAMNIKKIKKDKEKKFENRQRKTESNKGKKTMKRKFVDSSTSESDIEMEFKDETDVEYFEEEEEIGESIYDQKENDSTQNNQNDGDKYYDETPTSTVTKGQWLLVKFENKSTVKHYIGEVIELTPERLPIVKYARKNKFSGSKDTNSFIFPIVPDICEVRHIEDIVCKLPDPIIGRRGQICFKINFQGYNIQ